MMPAIWHYGASTMLAHRWQISRGGDLVQTMNVRDISFRKATPEDTDRIAEIIHSEPGPDMVRTCGGVERARAMGYALVRIPGSSQGWDRSVVGELDGEAVVVLQAGEQIGGTDVTPRLALQAIRIMGLIGAIKMLPRIAAQRRATPPAPKPSYHISELHVHPEHRGRGIGGAALEYAEADARQRGQVRMSLVTTTLNPARRLYERDGFRVVETRTDADYEKYTGIPGRHLMVKELT